MKRQVDSAEKLDRGHADQLEVSIFLPVSSGALASPVNNYSIDIGSSRARTCGSERYPEAKASL